MKPPPHVDRATEVSHRWAPCGLGTQPMAGKQQVPALRTYSAIGAPVSWRRKKRERAPLT